MMAGNSNLWSREVTRYTLQQIADRGMADGPSRTPPSAFRWSLYPRLFEVMTTIAPGRETGAPMGSYPWTYPPLKY